MKTQNIENQAKTNYQRFTEAILMDSILAEHKSLIDRSSRSIDGVMDIFEKELGRRVLRTWITKDQIKTWYQLANDAFLRRWKSAGPFGEEIMMPFDFMGREVHVHITSISADAKGIGKRMIEFVVFDDPLKTLGNIPGHETIIRGIKESSVVCFEMESDELDEDHFRGEHTFEYLINGHLVAIICDVRIERQFATTPATRTNPAEHSLTDQSVEIAMDRLYINEDEFEYTPHEMSMIEEAIAMKIDIS